MITTKILHEADKRWVFQQDSFDIPSETVRLSQDESGCIMIEPVVETLADLSAYLAKKWGDDFPDRMPQPATPEACEL